MADIPTPSARALVRAAAEDILTDDGLQSWQRPIGERNYRQMARGTLAALDWLEGRRSCSPSRGEAVRPEDLVELPPRRSLTPEMDRVLGIPRAPRAPSQRTEFINEIADAQDWGSGHVQAPNEDMHYHGAVWAVLLWWRSPNDRTSRLAIDVPGLFEPS